MDAIQKYNTFRIVKDAPILSLKGGNLEDTNTVLLKGTIVEGRIKTKIANINGEKTSVKLLAIQDEKDAYIIPSFVNIYTKEIEQIKGLRAKDTPTKSSALGETKSSVESRERVSKLNRFMLNVGVPSLTAYIGYRIAKKQGGDTKKILIYTFGFGLLGLIPKIISKNN